MGKLQPLYHWDSKASSQQMEGTWQPAQEHLVFVSVFEKKDDYSSRRSGVQSICCHSWGTQRLFSLKYLFGKANIA